MILVLLSTSRSHNIDISIVDVLRTRQLNLIFRSCSLFFKWEAVMEVMEDTAAVVMEAMEAMGATLKCKSSK